MRTIPVSANPFPASAPFPVATNPEKAGAQRGDDFVLRRRRFARLFHDDFFRGSGLSHDDTTRLAFDDAAGEQRQAGGNYYSFN